MKLVATAKVSLLVILSILFISTPAFSDTKPESPEAAEEEKSDIKETLIIEWPGEDDWYLSNTTAAGPSTIEIYFPKGDGGDAWMEMATVETVYGKTKVNLPGMARMTYLGTQRGCPDGTWDILDKGYIDEESKTPFITYQIICPEFLSGEPPQVQYWKLIAGKTALFNIQYSYRGEDIPKKKKEVILQALNDAHVKVEKKTEETESSEE